MRPTLIDPSDGAGADLSVSFVAPAAIEDGLAARLGLRRTLAAVRPTRDVGKARMINNDALPDIRVDAETFAIHVDGELIEPNPATSLPLAQLYAMF
jgi:urease subunit alpha